MKRLIAFISILLLVSLASGTATSITIYGTNKSNAQTNITCGGCNNSIYVNAWNTSYVKNITINSSNASGDVVTFNISNVTGYQVQELKVNKTAVNAYQAGANGMLNFSYTVVGNKTLTLSPALNANGYNFTWAYVWGGKTGITTQTVNRSYVKDTVYQNTNSSAMFITTTAYASASGTNGCNYKTGSTNPPEDMVGSQAETNADMQSFWVLPQHYFAALSSTGTCTILRWSVWQ